MVFDIEQYRYMEFLSDISGIDIKSHENKPEVVIKKIRSWLNTFEDLRPLSGASSIINSYTPFLGERPAILRSLDLEEEDVEYSDKTQIIEEWLKLHPI